jgi:hypothetical protein
MCYLFKKHLYIGQILNGTISNHAVSNHLGVNPMSNQIKLFPKAGQVNAQKLRLQRKEELEENLTDEMKLGRSGEQLWASVSFKVFGYGFELRHNDWSNYAKSQAKGVDVRVRQGKDLCFAIEIKNLNWQSKPYGTEFTVKEVLTRFEGLEAIFKILVISYKKLLTKEALRLLEENHIHVYEVGNVFKIGKHNPRANPEFYYGQVSSFKQFIDNLDPKVAMLQQTLEEAMEKQRTKTAEPPYFSYFNSMSISEYNSDTVLSNQLNYQSNPNINRTNSNLNNLTNDNLVNSVNNQVSYKDSKNNQLEIKYDTVSTLQTVKEQIIDILPIESLITPLSDG